MLGIYEIGARPTAWDMPRMASRADRKKSAEASARAIVRKLEAVKPDELSERQWCIDAKVSASFFSNLRGTPTKPPSDPSVDMLRSILGVVGETLPEFFADEAVGRVAPVPNRQALERAFREALPELPRSADRRVEYLAEVVEALLGLPSNLRATPEAADQKEEDDHAKGAPPHAATR